MKLTAKKLTQIIREEVEKVTKEASRTGVGAAPRGYNSRSSRSPKEKWADNTDPAYTPRKQRPEVSEETFDKIIDAVSELPGEKSGKPEKKSDEQGAGYVALRDFFLANKAFYKELVRQANLAWMDSKPEDKITDALHAADGLFSKVDPQMVLAILNAVNPAKFGQLKGKKLKESKTAADIMKALEAHGWNQKEFSAISGGAYGDDLTPEERARLDKKYDEFMSNDAVKALLKQYAQARRAERKGK